MYADHCEPYHVLHPSPAGNDSPALYVSLPQLHPQVGQHSSSPAGTAAPPRKLQEGDSQSTAMMVQYRDCCQCFTIAIYIHVPIHVCAQFQCTGWYIEGSTATASYIGY